MHCMRFGLGRLKVGRLIEVVNLAGLTVFTMIIYMSMSVCPYFCLTMDTQSFDRLLMCIRKKREAKINPFGTSKENKLKGVIYQGFPYRGGDSLPYQLKICSSPTPGKIPPPNFYPPYQRLIPLLNNNFQVINQ